jgi:hypothetical protein
MEAMMKLPLPQIPTGPGHALAGCAHLAMAAETLLTTGNLITAALEACVAGIYLCLAADKPPGAT